jgi:CelD/BcsL family acetyltransferase involved in cellulose biosynthesis
VLLSSDRLAQAHTICPITDRRWSEFLGEEPRASIFHTPQWLEALRLTYGYEPFVLTTAGDRSKLQNGIAFCRVSSWLTGRRIASVPFSDHCEPLVQGDAEYSRLLAAIGEEIASSHSRFAELRAFAPDRTGPGSAGEVTFCHHSLDLRPDIARIHRQFHYDCVQRKIRRAQREQLAYVHGRSDDLLNVFYGLMTRSRRRQRLPLQPLRWFRNLIALLGDNLSIRVASFEGQPVASILTLTFKNTVVYKYGCSDRALSRLGGMQLLLWRTIQEAKAAGIESFDLGRSDWANPGLITFKDRWGAARTTLAYRQIRNTLVKGPGDRIRSLLEKQVAALAPDRLVTAAGRAFYRHFG